MFLNVAQKIDDCTGIPENTVKIIKKYIFKKKPVFTCIPIMA